MRFGTKNRDESGAPFRDPVVRDYHPGYHPVKRFHSESKPMSATYKVWQLCNDPNCSHDHPVLTVGVEDGECPACKVSGVPRGARAGHRCLMAFVRVDKPMPTQVRELEVVELKRGLTVAPDFNLLAFLSQPAKGWACTVPKDEDFREHGVT